MGKVGREVRSTRGEGRGRIGLANPKVSSTYECCISPTFKVDSSHLDDESLLHMDRQGKSA